MEQAPKEKGKVGRPPGSGPPAQYPHTIPAVRVGDKHLQILSKEMERTGEGQSEVIRRALESLVVPEFRLLTK